MQAPLQHSSERSLSRVLCPELVQMNIADAYVGSDPCFRRVAVETDLPGDLSCWQLKLHRIEREHAVIDLQIDRYAFERSLLGLH